MDGKRIITIVLAFLMLISVITSGTMAGFEHQDIIHAEDVDNEESDYIVRAPIRINGNDDFAAQAADEGWPGDGSEGNPYVIEGYEINGTGYGYGIYVGNTRVHFVVRGCYVHNASGIDQEGNGGPIPNYHLNSGIILLSVENSKIENNTLIYNAHRSIYLGLSTSNVIIQNNISHNVAEGISLSGSNNNTIIKNTLSNNIFGICLAHSVENTIIHNDIYHEKGSSGSGINLQDTDNNFINNNTISNYRIGIFGINSFDNEIENNAFSNVETEIDFSVMVENGNETNGDRIPASGFAFFVIVILAVSMLIWKKKDKLKELKK